MAKAMLTSASLSLTGDLVAQTLDRRQRRPAASAAEHLASVDWVRALRMGGFGLLFYGPLQHRWYGLLNARLPTPPAAGFAANVRGFAAKVALNQLVLGPSVVAAVFAWNLAFERRLREWPAKLARDALPTLRKGWAFWVPAATVNFVFVPLPFQVLYMSTCSIVWTTILSSASAKTD
jgi:protein Mpv17